MFLRFFGKTFVLTTLSDYATSRKEVILRNLQDADNRFKEASDNLTFAKEQFEVAKVKSEQIRSQGVVIANQTSKKLIEAVEEDIKRLKDSALSTIRFEEEKSIAEVVNYLLNTDFLLLISIFCYILFILLFLYTKNFRFCSPC